ncbi:Hsp20/alpha crystallin family protein [Staphylococcus gallinarum]|jgi:HSP20 family protein|uniref:Heat-shock protein n=1 Tax=Staphylococcus gallinarum TaxID=1293 RepID=A0ABQ0Y354_STAGA|nr:Hsp20/alpha crystallin family protein [Staphylococcus gallinarum]KIR11227.1 heat-shock protein [Staphylococcus gallinarum]MBU7217289.1 Hsp20/alpha crystallin family protein [Staphylococcus gallinarum]MCD8785096.1 Hsp20/alpha crystallin family protein [Staphylococcus gallinarum]MCD8792629.1 Hsp20/alpha crystallin family protein [Staphylococcus gallinarum]MCD8845294.1 Hsp20/alpha crystallin family protein [Staphylococcus gallinarum]
MAFEKKPFNNSIFDVNPSDLFKDFGKQIFDQFPNQTQIKSDVTELEDYYLIEAELPGIKKENISLAFDKNILTIEAKQAQLNTEEDSAGKIIHQERSYSDLKRQFNFDNVNEQGITAAHDNGILRVTLPKLPAEENKATRIEIN